MFSRGTYLFKRYNQELYDIIAQIILTVAQIQMNPTDDSHVKLTNGVE